MKLTKYFTRTAAAVIVSAGLMTTTASAGNYNSDHHSSSKMKADIVDTAVNAGSFNTLVAAVQAAGLESTLRGEGPFTVFAPTDEAFAKLPAGTVEMLLQPENKHKLADILTYHVVPGKIKSSKLAGQKLAVESVEGSNIFVDGRDGVKVDNATVIKADIKTSNGIIHVIDSVIMP